MYMYVRYTCIHPRSIHHSTSTCYSLSICYSPTPPSSPSQVEDTCKFTPWLDLTAMLLQSQYSTHRSLSQSTYIPQVHTLATDIGLAWNYSPRSVCWPGHPSLAISSHTPHVHSLMHTLVQSIHPVGENGISVYHEGLTNMGCPAPHPTTTYTLLSGFSLIIIIPHVMPSD